MQQPEQRSSYSVPGGNFSQPGVSPVKNSKKTIVTIVSIILGLAIIGGGVFGYFYYFQYYFQSPEKIVQKMVGKMAQVKSLEYTGQITAEMKRLLIIPPSLDFQNSKEEATSTEQKTKLSIGFSGASDLHDLNNPKAMFRVDVSTDMSPEPLGLEIRVIDKVNYLKLSNIPNLGFFSLPLSFLENKWIKVDSKIMKYVLKGLEEQSEEEQKEQELTPEEIEQIKEIVARKKIFRITEKLASEKIDGKKTYHYRFIIDKEELGQLFTEIGKVAKNKILTETELQEIQDLLQAIRMPEGEIWIGKKDLLLYKILLNLDIKETEKTKVEGNVNTSIQFKNYNKPVQIEVPASAKTIEEIIAELFGGFFGGGLQNLGPGLNLPSR